MFQRHLIHALAAAVDWSLTCALVFVTYFVQRGPHGASSAYNMGSRPSSSQLCQEVWHTHVDSITDLCQISAQLCMYTTDSLPQCFLAHPGWQKPPGPMHLPSCASLLTRSLTINEEIYSRHLIVNIVLIGTISIIFIIVYFIITWRCILPKSQMTITFYYY